MKKVKNIGDLINTFYEQNILAYIQSLQEYPIKFVSLILDITIVVFLAYELIKIVKGSRAWQLIKGIAFLVVATGVSKLLNLYDNIHCTQDSFLSFLPSQILQIQNNHL